MPDQNGIREKQATKLPEEPSTAQAAANFKFDDPIFGNSSAFDAFIQQNKANNIVILPSDDLPTVLAKNVRIWFFLQQCIITYLDLCRFSEDQRIFLLRQYGI